MIFGAVPPRIYIATHPVDFRKGMDGLAALVQEVLRLDPFGGTVFIFRAKRADRIKILIWDGSGLILISKRLEDGKFHALGRLQRRQHHSAFLEGKPGTVDRIQKPQGGLKQLGV